MKLEDVLRGVVEEAVVEFRVKLREIEEEGLRRLREEADELSRQSAAAAQLARKEATALRQRLVSQAVLDARREYLETVEECVRAVFDEALRKISSMRETLGYRRALKVLLWEAVEVVGGDEVVVECSKADRSVVEELRGEVERGLGVKIRLSENSLDIVGGVRVMRRDGSAIYDNTVEARLERMRNEVRNEIIKRLLSP